jgi:hypothetical protein
MAKEGHTSNGVESGVGTLCPSSANRMDPHWAGKRGGEMVEPASAYHVGRSYCCICIGRGVGHVGGGGDWEMARVLR